MRYIKSEKQCQIELDFWLGLFKHVFIFCSYEQNRDVYLDGIQVEVGVWIDKNN